MMHPAQDRQSERIVILFVEDEPNMLQLFNKVFSEKGYQVLTASNGIRGLEAMMNTMPDLIVSDIMMPEMDGISFFKEVKERYGEARPVFIFLTAKVDENDIINGLTLGADDYLTKPVSIRQLQLKVEAFSNRLQSHRAMVSSGLIGSLKDQSIADIIQFLEISKHTGVLSVQMKGKTATMNLKDGKILSADFPPLTGSEAVYAMIALQDGTFRFEPKPDIDETERIEASSYALILEGLKRIDEIGRDQILQKVTDSPMAFIPEPDDLSMEDDITTEIHQTKRLMKVKPRSTPQPKPIPEWMHRGLLEVIASHCSEIEPDQIDYSRLQSDRFETDMNSTDARLTLIMVADDTRLEELIGTMSGVSSQASRQEGSYARIRFTIPDDLNIQLIGIPTESFIAQSVLQNLAGENPLVILHAPEPFPAILEILDTIGMPGFVVVAGEDEERIRQETGTHEIVSEVITGRFSTWLSSLLTLKRIFIAFAGLADRVK